MKQMPIDHQNEMETIANGLSVQGFIRFVDVEAPDADIDLADGVVARDVIRIGHDTLQRNLAGKDKLFVINEGEYLISFNSKEITSVERALLRLVSEIKSSVYKKYPSIEVLVDRYAEQVELVGNPSPDKVYEDLRQQAPTPEQRARLQDADTMSRTRALFQPFWSATLGATGPNGISIDFPAETFRRLKRAKSESTRRIIQALLDREHMLRALWASENIPSGRGRTEYVVPVMASTLLDETAARIYFEGLSGQIKYAAIKTIVEVDEVNADNIEALLASSTVAALRRSEVRMIMTSSLQEVVRLRSAFSMLHGISCTMTPTRNAETMRREANQWARIGQVTGTDIYMSSLNSLAQAQAAAHAGISWIRGNGIQFANDTPRAPQTYMASGFKVAPAA